ncbi:MAG: IclR family transcriptional regulator [Desulfobacterales bacterium]|nr:IclR family transcriptional regulator [Desulfobacterales bacterium]MDD4072577.1 IclR family transcriptional regulator [Desulfobacterales bacterium]MDD4393867.1 IclR family transcriptional regulator [Desulfobacterales bacterium]
MEHAESSSNSVEKALKILLAFRVEHPSWGVRALSKHLGFSPATVQRILQTLKSYNFVAQDPETRLYFMGEAAYDYLGSSLEPHSMRRIAAAFMNRLLTSTRETIHLNVIQDNMRLCIDCVDSSQPLKGTIPIGSTSPLYAGATPKCLLSFASADFTETYIRNLKIEPFTKNTINNIKLLREDLENIRKKGFALSMGERSAGLGSISAPVLDLDGRLLCCLSVDIPEIRFNDEAHRNFCIRELLEATREFSKVMGYQGGDENFVDEKSDS